MFKVYYRVWVDAILYQQHKGKKDADWKLFLAIAISLLQGLNLLAILFVIRAITHNKMPILLPVSIFNIMAINGFCSILFTFFVPFVILNYLLIFYNNKYQSLINIYADKKGKLYRNYFILSVGIIAVPLVIKIMFF